MNTVLVLVMLILVMFALKEGMMWVALGVGVVMVVVATGDSNSGKEKQKFIYPEPQLGNIHEHKEQMLKVKYKPQWDGNNWWEEIADHWGSSMGRTIGLLR